MTYYVKEISTDFSVFDVIDKYSLIITAVLIARFVTSVIAFAGRSP